MSVSYILGKSWIAEEGRNQRKRKRLLELFEQLRALPLGTVYLGQAINERLAFTLQAIWLSMLGGETATCQCRAAVPVQVDAAQFFSSCISLL